MHAALAELHGLQMPCRRRKLSSKVMRCCMDAVSQQYRLPCCRARGARRCCARTARCNSTRRCGSDTEHVLWQAMYHLSSQTPEQLKATCPHLADTFNFHHTPPGMPSRVRLCAIRRSTGGAIRRGWSGRRRAPRSCASRCTAASRWQISARRQKHKVRILSADVSLLDEQLVI